MVSTENGRSAHPDAGNAVSAVSYLVEDPAELRKRLGSEADLVKVRNGPDGDYLEVTGMGAPVPLGDLVGAGVAPESYRTTGWTWKDIPPAAWDRESRLEAMARDHVAAQVLYPSLALRVIGRTSPKYAKSIAEACDAILYDFCLQRPGSFVPVSVTCFGPPERAAAKLREARALGFAGAVLPCLPHNIELDYHHRQWDAVWGAAVEVGMPLILHANTAPEYGLTAGLGHRVKSPVHGRYNITRNAQQVLNLLIGAGVFDRHPGLQVVCAESDASWAPHLGVRLRHWESIHGARRRVDGELVQGNGHHADDYLWENVWYAISDDRAALNMWTEFGPEPHLMWADSFPTAESDWPDSASSLDKATSGLSAEAKHAFTRGNAEALFGINAAAQPSGSAQGL